MADIFISFIHEDEKVADGVKAFPSWTRNLESTVRFFWLPTNGLFMRVKIAGKNLRKSRLLRKSWFYWSARNQLAVLG
jgi:hypothetical protein